MNLPETRGGHVVATGVDIVSVHRVALALERRPALASRLLLDSEREFLDGIDSASSRIKSIAARIAAKEAVMKCLGQGFDHLPFRDIEVRGGRGTAPVIALHRRAQQRAEVLGISQVLISLTHDDTHAGATALALKECPCSPS